MTRLRDPERCGMIFVMTIAKPPITGTLETALYVDDLETAKTFWRDIIGLTPVTESPGRHAFFRVTDQPPQMLLLFRAESTEIPPACDAKFPAPPHGAHGPGHFCLAVPGDKIEDWKQYLIAQKIEIEADFYWPNHVRSIYFRDPAGNSIEISESSLWADHR